MGFIPPYLYKWVYNVNSPHNYSNSSQTIKIKYIDDYNNPPIEQNTYGDWIDLYVCGDYKLQPGDFALLNLGIAIELPQGYEALIAPRSSTFKNYGVLQANSVGIVDSSYNGNDDIWKMPVYATREMHIPHGSRLCQFRIIKNQPSLIFNSVPSLGNKNRGGFGSTGK